MKSLEGTTQGDYILRIRPLLVWLSKGHRHLGSVIWSKIFTESFIKTLISNEQSRARAAHAA